ncbi:hypothetical protein HL658_07260 [Azospirillum sp. RWY-5-1]|uniref:Uncharacterized protein n=1 Tax=Azospirillum oleiclasticum TaxID=2735135 RepID=A0ABX2T5A7_9PROT|nr:hypothetical protein [Azospirillum oleiclasticum]NYZ12342.1 hypothetical protein [Azospirillum oleiclasticum]NYZ19502.1 hypothetical protein [Azospirillum oleiclasticum]
MKQPQDHGSKQTGDGPRTKRTRRPPARASHARSGQGGVMPRAGAAPSVAGAPRRDAILAGATGPRTPVPDLSGDDLVAYILGLAKTCPERDA